MAEVEKRSRGHSKIGGSPSLDEGKKKAIEETNGEVPAKRGPGRPPKKNKKLAAKPKPVKVPGRGRGRPPKVVETKDESNDDDDENDNDDIDSS